MGMEVAEIAFTILFEMVTVDHNRWRCLAFPAVLLIGFIIRVGIFDDEDEPLTVGRPFKLGYAAFDACELLRLSAGAVEQPYLRAQLFLRFVSAARQKCQVLI